MTAILENPLPAIFLGVVVEAILIALLLGTHKKVWLAPIVGVLLLAVALVAVERLVVTEREEVEYTIDSIAAALAANNIDAVLAHLSDSAQESRARARWALDRIEVNSASVSGLEITINSLTSPPTAKAVFSGVIKFEDRKKEYPYQAYMSKFELELRKEGDRWKVTGHKELEPSGR